MAVNSPRLEAFQSDTFATGLDLKRCEITRNLGVYKASEGATIRQGQMVALNASQELVVADSNGVRGVARWNKALLGKSLNVDEPVTLTGTTTMNLARPNVSNVSVRSAPNQGGTVYTGGGTDYTVNTTNGTITRVALGAIPSGDTVYVTYTYDMTESDYRFQGKNFFNTNDDVSPAEGRLAIVQGPATIFTTEYDTSRTYALTGAGASLFCGGTTAGLEGLFTNNPAEGRYVGRVIQLPSAADPFLGLEFSPHPEEE